MRSRNPTKPGNRLGMPFAAWPPSDQAAWNSAFAPGSLFDEHPHGRDLRQVSRVTLATCYARWLAWLKANHPGVLELGPGDRATKERVVAYLRALNEDLAPRTVYNYASRLKDALALLAPDVDWSWCVPLLRKLEHRARTAAGSRPKPVVPTRDLMDFGVELMRQAERKETLTAIAQAETYRDGLMIAFLAARPLRLKNMLSLEIGTDFIEANGSYEVALLEEATKTKVGIEFPVPTRLVSYIRRYLTHHRKILQAGPDGPAGGYMDQANYLWLARSGRQFPVASFEDIVARRTTEHFGVRLTPHRFRNCAATSIAENNPEEFHIIRIILGHSTIATAEQYYIQAKNREAVRMVQDNVITLRKPTAKRAPAETIRSAYAADTLLFAGHSEIYRKGFIR